MKPHVSTRAHQSVPLRGYERVLTMVDKVSTKIVHSMLVRGPTTILLQFLATPVMNTFNMHPRMRSLQDKGREFMAEIHPPLTRHDVTSFALVRVRMVSSVASNVDDMMSGWQQYADDECSIGFDQFKQLPFFLTVWVDEREDSARLMLFSDSYMSDGHSGMVVLNCILERVAILANEQLGASRDESKPKQPPRQVQELPLRPPLYKMWLSNVAWAKSILKCVVSVTGRKRFRDRVMIYKPLLSARAGQRQFTAPPATNSSTALFALGDPECMMKVVAKCKEENVTVGGALVGIMILAFYHVMKERKSNPSRDCFKIAVDLGFNMCRRVPNPADEEQVGMYTALTSLDWLTCEGANLETTSFWDLARCAKQAIIEKPMHTLAMALPTVLMDKYVNSRMKQSFLKGVYLPNSLVSDINISNLGIYPYSREHQVSGYTDEFGNGDLTVESLHVYHPLPHLASSATFFITALLLNSAKASIALAQTKKLLDVLNRVALRYTGHDYV
ncbi:unnamed protein product [Phytophthora fragariaefolia]|uniref:Unnamed protein product n=1 Tax=Phytophthora fragariaefolia TaxID=1490495 RepID=A0A9W6UCW5_9STRA|nr:unnamed protein product [Phytophthora fragariaefolia]